MELKKVEALKGTKSEQNLNLIMLYVIIKNTWKLYIFWEVDLKKNIFDLFLEKILNVPLWIKQAIYLRLAKEMQEYDCEDFLIVQIIMKYYPNAGFISSALCYWFIGIKIVLWKYIL